MNPDFQKPTRPFTRMKYTDAIDWLNKQDPPILNEDDEPHKFGDDIAEGCREKDDGYHQQADPSYTLPNGTQSLLRESSAHLSADLNIANSFHR